MLFFILLISLCVRRAQSFRKLQRDDIFFKIATIGIIVAVLNQVLSRAGRDEQAMMTTLAGLVVVLMMVVQEIAQLFTMVKTLFHL